MTRAEAKAAFDQAEDFEPDPWPDPEPLIDEAVEPLPYPVSSLPEIIRDAVTEYQQYGQQPLALVGCSALSAAALVTQGLADVARDERLVGPCSLNSLIIADSGERKTSADRRLSLALHTWQLAKREEMRPQIEEANSEIAAYRAQRDGLLSQIRQKMKAKKSTARDAGLDALKHELVELDANAPHEPIQPSLFLEDVTPEGLGLELAKGWPVASLWSDEGGLIVGGHGMGRDSALRFVALLNRLWDGRPLERRRVTAESFEIVGRRFGASLMVQPYTMSALLAAAQGVARGTGHLARFLIAWPPSTMGTRLYRVDSSDEIALRRFDDRLTELLDLPLPITDERSMRLQPPVLVLSPPGFDVWRAFHDDVERELGADGQFTDHTDFAAKAAENAARIACVCHVIENGPNDEIAATTIENSARLAAWHLHETKRALGAIGTSGELADALALLGWLIKQPGPVGPRDISRMAPERLRRASRRDAALAILKERHWVREVKDAGKTVFVLNPAAKDSL